LRQSLRATTRAPGVERGVWAIAVHSLDRDERLFELNPRTMLVPGSVAKLVAAATAADAVGWDFRYTTTLLATGPVIDGVLHGDLIAAGSGDPSIGGRAGDEIATWIDAVRTAGIRRVDGRVIGDDDAIEDPRPQLAWAWDDLGYTSGAMFGALNMHENRTFITVLPGTAGAPAELAVSPLFTYREIVNRTMTGARGSPQLLWPEQRPGEEGLTIAGSIPVGARPAVMGVSVGNPTRYFAQVLHDRLRAAGVDVTRGAIDIDDAAPSPLRDQATVIHTHRSRPLAELVQAMLKDSINLYAEAAMRLNVAPGVFPDNDAALAGVKQRLEAWGVNPTEQQLIDGSGLSRRDAVTAEALLVVLRRMHAAGAASPFLAALPIAGVDGSLASRMRATPAEGNVRAKTGTMSNIRSLAGYVTTADGERLAFVVMVNNFEGPGAAAVQVIDTIAVTLAGFRR
jgi:D-alanyl-D-alanine carboxypeptidase/D-alanyl-D-alanine-endopeptidase (penicillin-binding protein 4)